MPPISDATRLLLWITSGVASLVVTTLSVYFEENIRFAVRRYTGTFKGGRKPKTKQKSVWVIYFLSLFLTIVGAAIASSAPSGTINPIEIPKLISFRTLSIMGGTGFFVFMMATVVTDQKIPRYVLFLFFGSIAVTILLTLSIVNPANKISNQTISSLSLPLTIGVVFIVISATLYIYNTFSKRRKIEALVSIDPRRLLKIFLCHSSSDKPKVRTYYDRLKKENGLDPWLDTEKLLPGMDWDLEIRSAVRSSDAVLVFLSKQSVNKEGYIQKEIKQALDVADEKPDGTIFIIPLRLEECEVPDRLRRWQWLDLFEIDSYDKLLNSLRRRAVDLAAKNLGD